MRFTPFLRSFVTCAYLLALVLHGHWDGRSAVLAVAVLAVWAAPAIRDARRSRAVVAVASAR